MTEEDCVAIHKEGKDPAKYRLINDDPRMSKKNSKVTAKCCIMVSNESRIFQQF